MELTLKDWIASCQLYENSAEHYELMKECSEVVLIEQYIDNQLFLMEQAEIMESGSFQFEEGYFQESANENSLEAICESADEKKKNIFGRIWDGLKKLVRRFANFLGKLAGEDDVKDLQDKIKKLKDDKEEGEEVNKKLNEYIDAAEKQYGIKIRPTNGGSSAPAADSGEAFDNNQAFGRKSTRTQAYAGFRGKGGIGEKRITFEQAADGLFTYHLVIVNTKNGYVADPDVINAAIEALKGVIKNDKVRLPKSKVSAVKTAKDNLEKSIQDSKQAGININLKDSQKKIAAIATSMEKDVANIEKGMEVGKDARQCQEAMELYTLLTKCIGDTSKIFTIVSRVRNDLKNIIKGVNTERTKAVKAEQKAAKAQAKAEKEQAKKNEQVIGDAM